MQNPRGLKPRGFLRRPAGSRIYTSSGEVDLKQTEFVWKRNIWLGCNVLVLKAGDRDRTRDVQGRKTPVFHRVSRPERPFCQLGKSDSD